MSHHSDKMLHLVRSFMQEGLLVGAMAECALSITEDEVLRVCALVEAVDAQVSQVLILATDQRLAEEISDSDRLEE